VKISNLVLCCGLVLLLVGCGSPKNDPEAHSHAKAVVSEVTELKRKAERNHTDLLSVHEYTKGNKYLMKAEQGLSSGRDSKTILENAELAKVQFLIALEQSGARRSSVPRILQARQSVLGAGVRNSDKLVGDLADIDDDLRSATKHFAKKLAPKKFSKFQKRYFSLEVDTVQFIELDAVKNRIKIAKKNKAGKRAPASLRMAKMDLSAAENLVAQSPRNPRVHKNSVSKAKDSSVLLAEVMKVILGAKGTPEKIALQIVSQNSTLGSLSDSIGNLESSLRDKEGELAKSSVMIRFQEAMDEAVLNFSDDEATVYQQGNKLIFRLKKINFSTGVAAIPPGSKPLLSKINEIIGRLGSETVVVEGHTDSVGTDYLNAKLSSDRAISVATYLTSLPGSYKVSYIGYGESRPIATNETSAGRATNRRVDLVVSAKR
jgi:outer membrane protein OmpA-like peptidoglycan-associated protein